MPRLKFRPSLRTTRRANDAALQFLCGGNAPAELLNNVAPKRERAAPRKLEAPVIKAISELLAVHPRVDWVLRMNSGSAGEFSQVRFHRWIKPREGLRMSDFFGFLTDGMVVAFEAKHPLWKTPSNQREREQAAFLARINHYGIGMFITDAAQVAKALK